jgi:hypothetical protein
MRNSLISLLLLCSLSLSAQMTDSVLFAAYQREDMSVWKEYIHTISNQQSAINSQTLLIEYGYCGYIVAEAKKEGKEALMPEAKRCVQQFKSDVINHKSKMPVGHYEMYMSAVYVFELRLHESIHPMKAMSLAKEATKLAPDDPLTLAYYGTSLFYAPKPFGSKEEALAWFEKAQVRFGGDEWKYCWVREANEMYIKQCREKLKK